MDKGQALQAFWSSFDIPAYDESTVPDDAPLPYITYQVQTDSIDTVLMSTASVWYKGYSWKDISKKVDEIAERISRIYPPAFKLDNGRLYISMGTPFAQRMSEPEDDSIRRIVLNVNYEFLTEF